MAQRPVAFVHKIGSQFVFSQFHSVRAFVWVNLQSVYPPRGLATSRVAMDVAVAYRVHLPAAGGQHWKRHFPDRLRARLPGFRLSRLGLQARIGFVPFAIGRSSLDRRQSEQLAAVAAVRHLTCSAAFSMESFRKSRTFGAKAEIFHFIQHWTLGIFPRLPGRGSSLFPPHSHFE